MAGLREMIDSADEMIGMSQTLRSNASPERAGAYLTLMEYLNPREHMARGLGYHMIRIGVVPEDKEDKYMRLSQEKALRLAADWLRDPSSKLSSQSRQPEIGRWGGAVIFDKKLYQGQVPLIISISGFPEIVDEAMSAVLGFELGLADRDYIESLEEISGNPAIGELFDRWQGAQ